MIKQISAFAIATVLLVGAASAQEMKAFEGDEDVAFAMKLWTVLESEKLVGPNRIHAQPFEGNPPHGGIQQVLGTDVNVDGRMARVWLKPITVAKASVSKVSTTTPIKTWVLIRSCLSVKMIMMMKTKTGFGQSITPKVNSIKIQKVPRLRVAS